MLTKLALMVVLSITSIAASQEPYLPDDVLKQIVAHRHEPQYRLVNKCFRDNVVIHLFKPVTFELCYRREKLKSRWFREMISNDRLYMHDYWVFDNRSSAGFLDAVIRKRGSVKVEFLGAKGFIWRRDVEWKTFLKYSAKCIVEFSCDNPEKKNIVTFLDHDDNQPGR